MTQQAKELSERFRAFNDKINGFVEKCSNADWKIVCEKEGWTVGVVARHVAEGHYGVIGLVKMMIADKPLPEINMTTVDQMNAAHAEEHADCTKEEVQAMLDKNGSSIVNYLASLSDEELSREVYFSLAGQNMTPIKIVDDIMITGCSEHLASMEAVMN